MPFSLKNLQIDEVSSVDRGAGERVKIVLMKRDGNPEDVVIDLAAIRAALAKKSEPVIAAAIQKLRERVAAIKADAAVTDKDAAAAEAVATFKREITGEDPGSTETTMKPEEITKAITEAVTKAVAPLQTEIAKITFERDFALMPQAHQDFAKAMSEEDKKKFMDKKPEERDAEAKKAADAAKGDPVVKALTGEVETLKKRLAVADERDAIAKFEKRATDLGLPAAHGEIMRKAYAGDADAIAKHDELLKGLTEQVKTGKVFAEFGSQTNVAKSPYDQLVAKADELRKTETKLTKEQAFDKVYNDPANTDLREAHKASEFAKRQPAAA